MFSLSLVTAILHLQNLGIRQEVEQIRANVFLAQRYVSAKLEIFTTFLFRENRTQVTHRRTDGNTYCSFL